MLPHHARYVLSRLHCNERSLLLSSYLSRIGRIENSSCSACGPSSQNTSHLILHCPAMNSFWRLLFGDSVSVRPLVQTLGSCPASAAPWSPAMPPSLGRGRVTNNNNRNAQNGLSLQFIFFPVFFLRLFQFCNGRKLCVADTWFKKEDQRKISMGGNEIDVDFVLISKNNRKCLRDVKALPWELQRRQVATGIDNKIW